MPEVSYACTTSAADAGRVFLPVSGNLTSDCTQAPAHATGFLPATALSHTFHNTPLLPAKSAFASEGADSLSHDVVLGTLSLLVISLLSSIVYDLLLRARPRRADGERGDDRWSEGAEEGKMLYVGERAVSVVVALQSVQRGRLSFGHFVRHNAEQPDTHVHKLEGSVGDTERADADISAGNDGRGHIWWYGLLSVAFMASCTFSAEVALIVATQTTLSHINGTDLGFRLVTPATRNPSLSCISADDPHALSSDREDAWNAVKDHGCITPSVFGPDGSFLVRVQTCFNHNFTEAASDHMLAGSGEGRVEKVTITSVFHRRGCDHSVTVAIAADGIPNLRVELSVRAKVYQHDKQIAPLEVLRPAPRSLAERATERRHVLQMHHSIPASILTATASRDGGTRCSSRDKRVVVPYRHDVSTTASFPVGQEINGTTLHNATVYTTTFSNLQQPTIAAAPHAWAESALAAAVRDVALALTDAPQYVRGRDDTPGTLDTRVYIRRTRRCTTATLAVLLAGLLVLKLAVAMTLRPKGLHRAARQAADAAMAQGAWLRREGGVAGLGAVAGESFGQSFGKDTEKERVDVDMDRLEMANEPEEGVGACQELKRKASDGTSMETSGSRGDDHSVGTMLPGGSSLELTVSYEEAAKFYAHSTQRRQQ